MAERLTDQYKNDLNISDEVWVEGRDKILADVTLLFNHMDELAKRHCKHCKQNGHLWQACPLRKWQNKTAAKTGKKASWGGHKYTFVRKKWNDRIYGKYFKLNDPGDMQ